MGPARKAGRVRRIRRADGAPRRSEAVYAELRQAILRGTLRAGERLHEEGLARRLRVSRTPVREAMGRLEAEGLAAALPRRGLAVAEVSPEHVMEIYLVREVLEGAACRLAARHVTHLEVARLEKLFEGMQDAAARDAAELPQVPLIGNLSRVEMAPQGARESRRLRLGLEADLDRLVSVPTDRLLLDHGTGSGLDDRDCHGLPVLIEDLGHPHLASQEPDRHRLTPLAAGAPGSRVPSARA
jgi:DNA-binding transcriptional regulator YhcF (GntR family)